MKEMLIKFRNESIDTEEVRECIEDNLRVEILGIEEEIKSPLQYCGKCNKYIKELNGNEQEELNEHGAFICTDCIQEEMEEENNILKCCWNEDLKEWYAGIVISPEYKICSGCDKKIKLKENK